MSRDTPQVEYADFFDDRLLTEYERRSIDQRLSEISRQLGQVVASSRHLRLPRRGGPPSRPASPESIAPFLRFLEEAAAGPAGRPGLKREVSRRVVDEVCRFYLWSNLSSLPGFHELTILVPFWAGNRALAGPLRQLAEVAVRELLHGLVLSLQTVRREVLEADEVFLAHCACRSSGIAHDLEQNGEVFTIVDQAQGRLLLDRLIDRFEALSPDRLSQTTAPELCRIFEELSLLRRSGSPRYRLERLLRQTWLSWELLPVKEGFTTNWVRSLQNNGKCAPLDRELAFEMVNVFFHGRGAVFNSMKCADSPYTICTCPTPENEGGCVLTNWHYYGAMNNSLIPADDHHGRRRDGDGRVLECRYFPVRARRECIGCGCDHTRPRGPRDLTASLAEADALLAHYR